MILILFYKNKIHLFQFFFNKSFFSILFDLIKPSNACSGALVFGPFISSDNIFICLSKPSKTIINLFGVDNEKLFFDLIDFSKKNF